jgi:hypothetical protein
VPPSSTSVNLPGTVQSLFRVTWSFILAAILPLFSVGVLEPAAVLSSYNSRFVCGREWSNVKRYLIYDSHKYCVVSHGLLGCDVMWSHRWLPAFQWNVLS